MSGFLTGCCFVKQNYHDKFSNIANIYFLFLICLQSLSVLKSVEIWVTALPLIIVLAITAIKDALEDWNRLKADSSVNSMDAYCCKNVLKKSERQDSSAYAKEFIGNPSIHLTRLCSSNTDNAKPQPDVIEDSDYLDSASTISTEHAWTKIKWMAVKQGQYLLVRNDESIPADIVIISTSEPDSLCFIETKNLDGETNLKVKRGHSALEHVKSASDCAEITGFIEAGLPSSIMFDFTGRLRMACGDGDSQTDLPLDISNVLLRGCVLRNTKWVIGIVVGVGPDTKLMLNSGATPSKKSRIDRQLNTQVLMNLLILAMMCTVCGVLGAIYQNRFNYVSITAPFVSDSNQNRIPTSDVLIPILTKVEFSELLNPLLTAIITFASCLIIFQNIIPIAIYISVDFAKSLQSYFIYADDKMVDDETKTHANARSWNLCDDLGQIEYIFSDKTGTLTCNVMEFRKCSINGVVYGGSFLSQANLGAARRGADGEPQQSADPNYEKTRRQDERHMRAAMLDLFDSKYVSKHPLAFVDTTFHKNIIDGRERLESSFGPDETTDQASKCIHFFTLLAICHTVLIEINESAPDTLIYKAQSPDEAALVSAARDVGFAFTSRVNNVIEINVIGHIKKCTILHILEFSSDRKRMSVVLRMHDDPSRVLLFCKGADSVIFERLEEDIDDLPLRELTLRHLEMFANDGLRTLSLAYKSIPNEEYVAWAEEWRTVQSTVAGRDEAVALVASKIECGLCLMGATAIEDKLQDGVPETIALLSKAGIKIWVLTGDKLETAINIGFASNLLDNDMLLIVIKGATDEISTLRQIKDALQMFWDSKGLPTKSGTQSLIIDGESLTFALGGECREYLLELACRCRAVICCRVSPLQKAQVVALVRTGLSTMCLAIGDGANDVSMIQEANIGVGISGQEGMQAAMSSDYSISQFRFLSRLLLVHGRWSYLRTSQLILNYFYKNIVWLFVLFWYQFDSAFTGDIVTDFAYGMFYNTIFSLLPNLVLGVFDQDINDEFSLSFPQIYRKGIQQHLYNMELFWAYILDGVYQSGICYITAKLIFEDSGIHAYGYNLNRDEIGTYLSFYCIVTVNLYLSLNNFTWNWITHASLWATLIVFTIYVVIYLSSAQFSESPVMNAPTLVQTIFLSPTLYISLLLTIVASLLPRMIIKYVQQTFIPSDTDILQEYQVCVWSEGDVVDIAGNSETALKNSESTASTAEERPESLKSARPHSIASRRSSIVPDQMFFSTNRPAPKTLKERFIMPLKRLQDVFKKSLSSPVDTSRGHLRPIVYMGSPVSDSRNTGFAFDGSEGMGGQIVAERS